MNEDSKQKKVRPELRVLTILSIIFVAALFWSCAEEVTPPPSVSHPVEWNQTEADNFHGNKVLTVGNESCQTCHGEDYMGGSSGVACHDCHANYPHPPEWTTPKDENSHSNFLKDIGWKIEECQSCHGDDYKGGRSGESCYDCHTGSKGPESCNVCHGESAVDDLELYSWAPPKDLEDNLLTTNIGVGAHQVHIKDSTWTTAYEKDCNQCHISLTGFEDPNHRNGNVDMEFGLVATDSGKVNPDWKQGEATCSDVYCHGNFALGSNVNVVWNEVGSGHADCGTCHGLPPQPGHPNNENCHFCHSSVVDADKNIIDKTKHINGFTDY